MSERLERASGAGEQIIRKSKAAVDLKAAERRTRAGALLQKANVK